ncbi:hypothetical protein ACHAWF_010904 [Thalassiosira exigua]
MPPAPRFGQSSPDRSEDRAHERHPQRDPHPRERIRPEAQGLPVRLRRLEGHPGPAYLPGRRSLQFPAAVALVRRDHRRRRRLRSALRLPRIADGGARRRPADRRRPRGEGGDSSEHRFLLPCGSTGFNAERSQSLSLSLSQNQSKSQSQSQSKSEEDLWEEEAEADEAEAGGRGGRAGQRGQSERALQSDRGRTG